VWGVRRQAHKVWGLRRLAQLEQVAGADNHLYVVGPALGAGGGTVIYTRWGSAWFPNDTDEAFDKA